MSIFFFILSQLCYGVTNILWKKPQEGSNTLSLIISRSFFTMLTFGMLTLYTGDYTKWTPLLGLKAILFCGINYFGLFFYLKSLQEKKISEIVGLGKMSTIFGLLIGIFYFHEDFSFIKFLVITMIILSVFLIENHSHKKSFWSKGFLYAFLSCFFWSSGFLFKEALETFGVYLFSFILESTVFSMSIILLKINRERFNIKGIISHKTHFILLVILGLIAIFSGNKVVETLPVTLMAILHLLTPLTTILLSIFYYKENLSREQWIGVGIGILALFILNIKA